MKTIMQVMFAIGLAVMPVLVSGSAGATALNHTWVASAASGGSDSNNCDRPTPCATFQGAYNNTAADGEITCVDSADFGGVGISQSITINCENAVGSNTFPGGTSVGQFYISSANSTVVLRGLDFDGLGVGQIAGCTFVYGGYGVLRLQKVKLNHIPVATSNCPGGIYFTPGGPTTLDISDSDITDNNAAGSGETAGLYIQPASGAEANVIIKNSRINSNSSGIVADGTRGGTIRATISNSVVSGNSQAGIEALSSGSTVWVLVDQTKVSDNGTGLAASGSGVEILVRNSSVFGNTTGLSTSTGGLIYSYGTNSLNGNATNGTFTGTVGLH